VSFPSAMSDRNQILLLSRQSSRGSFVSPAYPNYPPTMPTFSSIHVHPDLVLMSTPNDVLTSPEAVLRRDPAAPLYYRKGTNGPIQPVENPDALRLQMAQAMLQQEESTNDDELPGMVSAWELYHAETISIPSLSIPEPTEYQVMRPLDGIPVGTVVVLHGPPGSGKSRRVQGITGAWQLLTPNHWMIDDDNQQQKRRMETVWDLHRALQLVANKWNQQSESPYRVVVIDSLSMIFCDQEATIWNDLKQWARKEHAVIVVTTYKKPADDESIVCFAMDDTT